MKKKSNQIIYLLFFIAVPLLGGYLSSRFSMVETYSQLYKPGFFPPSWVFAPVWTILYVMMGLSAYLIWKKGGSKRQLSLFSLQLILNFMWTPIFFGLHQYFWAFVEIMILLAAIILTIISFEKKSKKASYLMLPYFLWVCFAALLNYAVFIINRYEF